MQKIPTNYRIIKLLAYHLTNGTDYEYQILIRPNSYRSRHSSV
jgi:hypothetical protein